MRGLAAPLACFALFLSVLAGGPPHAQSLPPLQRVPAAGLCVTNGAVTQRPGGRLAVDTSSSRAVVPGASLPAAEIRFHYVGPSADAKLLASGEMRRQIGIKLLAQDGCNLLYAMWRIEPEPRIVVSVKRNPGMTESRQCGNRGYTNVTPRIAAPAPKIQPGESHVLRAELSGGMLSVVADGAPVWTGEPGAGLAGISGPPGLRTDNARVEFEFFAAPGKGSALRVTRCEASEAD